MVNQNVVKELTKQGCMVDRDAAEILEKDDIQRIKELDVTPMYISSDMVERLRESNNQEGSSAEEVEKEVETSSGQMLKKVEKSSEKETNSEGSSIDDDYDYGETGKKFSTDKTVEIRDNRDRKELNTKVELLDNEEISREEKDVPEFLQYYNDRYDKMKKLLLRRREMKSATTINRLERRDEGEDATTVGLVKDKYSTQSGKWIVEIEDNTGTFKVLASEDEGEMMVQDEVIGVRGNMGGDIIYANSIIRPDLPIPQGVKTTQDQVRAAYISDLHLGSEDTLTKRFNRFGDWLNTEAASDIGYLVITGDIVEGVGTYPGQEDELEVTDIYKQYQLFEDWVEEKVPDDLQVIVGPGNHDIVRLAEPQPVLPEKALPNISDYNNVHMVQNPQSLRLHGIRSQGINHLMYHGYSFDDHADSIQNLRERAYEEPHHVMIDLLKRRHLAPTYGSNLLSPEETDRLVINHKPDVMVSGHFHSHSNESYKGVNVICSSTFQAQTDFQKRVGHEPDPGKVTIVDFKTRNTEVKQF
ncbi:MAG: DNA polymerase II small subunit [Colwellia polaris]|jgi:DNA polymerase II small subunit